MSAARAVWHLALADFRDRVRSGGFLVVLGITVFAAYMFVPPYGSPYATLVLGNHRGFYNSPWVGTVYGVVASVLLGLMGFYLVKSSVSRDYRTRVGQIIAATRTPKHLYMLGKWLSNLAVLSVVLSVLTVMAPVMQMVRAESTALHLGQLVAPIWLMGLPSLAVVSALAVLFESLPFLRGGLGNVGYFFLWGPGILASEGPLLLARSTVAGGNDILGLSRSLVSVREGLNSSGMDWSHGVSGVVTPLPAGELVRFTWNGLEWTGGMVAERLAWIGVAVAVALLAAVPFDRFDPARSGLLSWSRRSPTGRLRRGLAQGWRKAAGGLSWPWRSAAATAASEATAPGAPLRLAPLALSPPSSRWGRIFAAELRLMLTGHAWLWYAGAVALVAAAAAVPLDVAHRYVLPAAWLWPLVLWSSMGNREMQHGTHPILFSVAHPVRRQFWAQWAAGVLVAALLGGGVLFRLALAGLWAPSLAWCAGAVFIPSLALALGTWSSGARLFEITYAVWWYLGPLNGIGRMDFTAATVASLGVGRALAYAGVAAGLMGAAWLGRRRQIEG